MVHRSHSVCHSLLIDEFINNEWVFGSVGGDRTLLEKSADSASFAAMPALSFPRIPQGPGTQR